VDRPNLTGQALAEMPKSPRSPPSSRTGAVRIIEVLAYPSVQLLDVTGPLQVFASANDMAADAGGTLPYSLRVVAKGGQGVTASAGLGIATRPLPRISAALDTLIVAGGPRVESDPIFVRDGTVWTSAGVSAGIDLALALVEEDLGRTAALAVARYLVVFLKRPGGQAQFSAALALQSAEDQFGALHDWINQHLPDDISLPLLARQAGMSERSFSRHYLEATGLTPARAVERLRVEAARRLLSETRLPVKRISQRCGFGSEETMRRSFLRVLSATPQDYRARFSS